MTFEIYRPTLKDITKGIPLEGAEKKFQKNCKTGEVAVFDIALPTIANTIRASLIRHAMLGGCERMPVSPKGVQIQGAWITGVLDLEGCDSPLDLILAGCNICEQPMLRDARLGSVMLSGCTVPGLDAHRLTVVRAILLDHQFKSTGTVDLSSTNIGGTLNCSNATFIGADGTALNCDAMTVGGDVFLRDGFTATGEVNLLGARITGQLNCRNATFDGAGGTALNCNAITVDRAVFLRGRFTATGEVNLVGAQITGQLDCSGATFNRTDGTALNCYAMTVDADVFLSDGFTATGEVKLVGAQITGQLDCSDATFDGADGKALICDAMIVGADVFLRSGFKATGQVRLVRAKITGNLGCEFGHFSGSVDCEGMSVVGGFFWQEVQARPSALNLTDAHVGSLRDEKDSWGNCTPILNGFRYDRIISDMSVRDRLEWLDKVEHKVIPKTKYLCKKTKDVKPQPYTQLASVLEAAGQRQGAALVRYEREQRVRPAENAKRLVEADSPKAKLFSVLSVRIKGGIDSLFGWSFGYGHRPMLVFRTIFLIWLGCFVLYGAAYKHGQMAPNSDVVLTSADWVKGVKAYEACTQEPCVMPLRAWEKTPSYQDYETFNRGLYALDLFVPLDALGQENAWAPSKDRGALGCWAYYARFLVQLSGWIITAIGAAALTGVIGRKE